MKKSVACENDIQAIENFAMQHQQFPNWSGKWRAGSIAKKVHRHFKINGQPVVYEANCVFTFIGTDTTTNNSVKDEEKLTLSAQKTLLQNRLNHVLCDMDEKIGAKGNKLKANCRNLLTTE